MIDALALFVASRCPRSSNRAGNMDLAPQFSARFCETRDQSHQFLAQPTTQSLKFFRWIFATGDARRIRQCHPGPSLLRRRALSGLRSAGDVTDIALEAGEQLVGSGPVAAGDTVRWVIGDTESGTGPTKRVHILVKPTRPDLVTNLVINTDRRTYHLELRSAEKTYMASVFWAYAQDQLIALRRRNTAAEAASPVAAGVDIDPLNFCYGIEGDSPAWRPLRAFANGAGFRVGAASQLRNVRFRTWQTIALTALSLIATLLDEINAALHFRDDLSI